MRINRVKTSSFAIAEDLEEGIERKKDNKTIELHKRYLPLGRFALVKAKGMRKGLLFKKTKTSIKKNNIYVDLSYGNICYAELSGLVKKKPRIQRTDIYRRTMGLAPSILDTLNHIWERGSTQTKGLGKEALIELSRMGLVNVFEPKDSQFMNLLRVVTDYEQITQYHVKPAFYLPKTWDKRYDLESYLQKVETADENYVKDPIRQSIKRICDTLGYLFNCDLTLEEITYLPYILEEKKGATDSETLTHYPVGLNGGEKIKRGYSSEVRLAPISLSTELYEGESVPVEKSTIGFADIGGLSEAKKEIMESIIYPFIRPDLSKRFGQTSGGGILFYGPPGCGKTQLARAAVTECNVSFFNVNISDIMNESGNEAKRLHDIFERAAENAPSIIFFDEIDALCSRKASGDESRKKVLNQFLIDMSGVERISEGVLVIAATNVPWELDPALRRAGRFTKQIYIPPPDSEARSEILRIYTKDLPLLGGVDLPRLSGLMAGYSGADISEVCRRAARIPWKKAVCGESEGAVGMDEFMSVLKDYRPSLIPWALSAEKQIRESNEESIYQELLKTVSEIKNMAGRKEEPCGLGSAEEIKKKLAELDRKELESLEAEKMDLEDKIRLLEGKRGGLEESIFQNMMGEYQNRMLELEVRMRRLR